MITRSIILLLVTYLATHAAAEPGLISENGQLEVLKGEMVELTCSATLQAGNTLIFGVSGGSQIYVVLAQSLDSPIGYPLNPKYSGVVDVSYGEISTANPPDRDVMVKMRIDSVVRSSEGNYSCQYSGDVSAISMQRLLVVGAPYDLKLTSESPGIVLEQQPSFDRNRYPESESVWHCMVDIDLLSPFELNAVVASRPQSVVRWLKQSYSVDGVTINLERDDEDLNDAEVTCSAENEYGSYNVTVILKAQYKPRKPKIIQDHIYPEEGGVFQLECQFDASPPAQVFYVKVDPLTNEWNRQNTSQSALLTSDVRLDRDIGVYKCVGSNSLGQSEGIITVHGEPRSVQIIPREVYGDSIDLTFMTFSALPVEFELIVNSTEDQEMAEKSIQLKVDLRNRKNTPEIRYPYTLSNLQPDTDYRMVLKASSRYGQSMSDVVNITTQGADVKRPVVEVKQVETKVDDNENSALSVASHCVTIVLCILLSFA